MFLSRIMQNSWTGWTRDQNIDLYEEISFLSKICCFYQKRKLIVEKLWSLVDPVYQRSESESNDHIQQEFQI